jgi:hypothetical protein
MALTLNPVRAISFVQTSPRGLTSGVFGDTMIVTMGDFTMTQQTDLSGRPWLKLNEAKAGMLIETDAGFTCIEARRITLQSDKAGLFFACADGKHYISGQADDGIHCVGLYADA